MAEWTTPDAVHSKCGESGGDVATNAIDDNLGTFWRHYITCYHWIIFDMGETKKITKIRIYQAGAGTRLWGYSVGLSVYISDNPADFGDPVWDGLLYVTGWQESGEFEKNGRYVKLLSKSNNLNQRMYEFDAYAEAVGVVHTKTFAETLALSDVVQKKPAKIFTESINLSDVYSRTWTLFRTYSEILTLNDFHLKKPSKTFPETLVLGDVLVKKTSKIFTETLNLSDVYSRIWDMYRTYTETLNLSDTLSKKAFKTFLEELNLSDILQKKLSKTFTENISLSDVFIKKPSKTFTETLSLADVLTKKPSKTFTETLTLSDVYSRKWAIYRTYVETLALRDLLIKKPSKTFTETLNLRDLPRTWKINPLETEKLLFKLKHLEDIAGD